MKNFNELFAEAKQVSDHRKEVFNRLIEKTKAEILPGFCDACAGFDIKTVYFKIQNKVLPDQEKHDVDIDYSVYCVAIDVQEKTISDANYYWQDGSMQSYNEDKPFNEVSFRRTGIVEFVKLLNNRLNDYVAKYAEKNKEASEL